MTIVDDSFTSSIYKINRIFKLHQTNLLKNSNFFMIRGEMINENMFYAFKFRVKPKTKFIWIKMKCFNLRCMHFSRKSIFSSSSVSLFLTHSVVCLYSCDSSTSRLLRRHFVYILNKWCWFLNYISVDEEMELCWLLTLGFFFIAFRSNWLSFLTDYNLWWMDVNILTIFMWNII